jgi:serine/threonine protein phosphatase PrpC
VILVLILLLVPLISGVVVIIVKLVRVYLARLVTNALSRTQPEHVPVPVAGPTVRFPLQPPPEPPVDVDVPVDTGPPPTAWLRTVRGPLVDVLLTASTVRVGRGEDCDILLDDLTVSRHHFTLLYRSRQWFVRAAGTANGTFVNNERIPQNVLVQLRPGDEIKVSTHIVLTLTTPQQAPADLVFQTGEATHRGGRPRNEDNHCAGETVVAVADGMGGRPGGARASQIATDMVATMPRGLTLSQFVPAIEAAIKARGTGDPECEGMATTLDAVQLIAEDGHQRLLGTHIGDSFTVVDDGMRIRTLTVPHTLGAKMGGDADHPERARLLRAIGLPNTAEVDVWEERAVAGHRYVLSTDGLLDALGQEVLYAAIRELRGLPPQNVADSLVQLGCQQSQVPEGSLDNLTVVVADVGHRKNSELSPYGQQRKEVQRLLSARR